MPKYLMSVLALLLLLCSTQIYADGYKSVTDGVKYKLIGNYNTTYLKKILTDELSDFDNATPPMGITFPAPANGVKLYRVIYKTVIPEKDDQATEASGLIAVPDVNLTGKTFPLLSWQHGTVFSKNEVPSFPENSMETRMILANLGGNGYVVIGADYIGRGLSGEANSYMAKDSNIQASADMLDASKAVLADLGVSTDKLFLSGWSQGAYNTQILLRHLEQKGILVSASAVASTPSTLFPLINRWINKRTKYDVQWTLGSVALLLNAYEYYYNLPGLTEQAIKPKYLQQARDFYSGKLSWDDISESWPKTTDQLLNKEFIAELGLASNAFAMTLLKNQAYEWRAKTPTRYYYGASDEVIAPYIATLPVEYQEIINGAEATAVYAGDNATHHGVFIYAVKDQKEWFDGLK